MCVSVGQSICLHPRGRQYLQKVIYTCNGNKILKYLLHTVSWLNSASERQLTYNHVRTYMYVCVHVVHMTSIEQLEFPSLPPPPTLYETLLINNYSSSSSQDMDTLQHLEGEHSWYACTHSRRTLCNVCGEVLHGVAWNGLSCEVCKLKSHRRCVFKMTIRCKWATRASLAKDGVHIEHAVSSPLTIVTLLFLQE